jgi:hypothetical protein
MEINAQNCLYIAHTHYMLLRKFTFQSRIPPKIDCIHGYGMMFALASNNKCLNVVYLCALLSKNHQFFSKVFVVLNNDKHVAEYWL